MSQRSCHRRFANTQISRRIRNINWNSMGLIEPLEKRVLLSSSPGPFSTLRGGVGIDPYTPQQTQPAAPGVSAQVDSAPVFTSNDTSLSESNKSSFTVGTSGSFSVTAAGTPKVSSIYEIGDLPTGVSFTDSGATGTLKGTPAAGRSGTYNITFVANNGIAPVGTQSFELVIDQVPVFNSAAQTTFVVGSPNTFAINTSTGVGPGNSGQTETISITSGTLPAGLTLTDNHDGTAAITGTPTTTGTFVFTLTANNGSTPTTQKFTLNNDATVSVSSTTGTFTVGKSGSFNVVATGFPKVTLLEVGTLPTGLSFSGTQLKGTPAAGTSGTYAIDFIATNGVSTTTQPFSLIVDQPPIFSSANSTTFSSATPGTFDVTVTGLGPSALTVSHTGTLPDGLTESTTNGVTTLTGSPAAGTYVFTLTAANGTSTTPQPFTLTVEEAPSITSSGTAFFTTSKAGTFQITTTGFPAKESFFSTGTLPTGISLASLNSTTAELKGTPTSVGTTDVVIYASNGVSPIATETVAIIVNNTPTLTVSNPTVATIQTGSTGTYVFTATGTGPSTLALTETGALPTGTTFTDNGSGTAALTGTPSNTSAGLYPITITATKGGSSVTQKFTLTVDGAPVFTSATAATFSDGAAGSFAVVTSAFPGPVTLSLSNPQTLPGGLTFNSTSGLLKGTAPSNGSEDGSYTLTFIASNSLGTQHQVFTLSVGTALSTQAELFTTLADFAGSAGDTTATNNSQVDWQGWGNYGTPGVDNQGNTLSFAGASTDSATANGTGNFVNVFGDSADGTSYAGQTATSGALEITNYQGGYDTVTAVEAASAQTGSTLLGVAVNTAFLDALGAGKMLAIDFTSPHGGTTLDSSFTSYFLLGFTIVATGNDGVTLTSSQANYSTLNDNPNGGFTEASPDTGNFGDDPGSFTVNHGTYFTAYLPYSYSVLADPTQYKQFNFNVYINSGNGSFYGGPSAPKSMIIDNIRIVQPPGVSSGAPAIAKAAPALARVAAVASPAFAGADNSAAPLISQAAPYSAFSTILSSPGDTLTSAGQSVLFPGAG